MKATAASLFVVISLTLAITPVNSQTRRPPPRSQYSPLAAQQGENPRQQRQTWYEFALSRLNPNNVDYGAWMEERRRAFLEATIKNQHFNYALAMTLVSLFLLAACAKLQNDGRRKDWVTAEMMTDLLNQDQHSREVAREAIRKYNDHIERCNRVIEAAESGRPVPGSATEAEELRAKLQEKSDELTAMTGERQAHCRTRQEEPPGHRAFPSSRWCYQEYKRECGDCGGPGGSNSCRRCLRCGTTDAARQ